MGGTTGGSPCRKFLVVFFACAALAACVAPSASNPIDAWSAGRSDDRIATYAGLTLDDLRAQAQAAFESGPRTGGTVDGAAYLYFVLGERLLAEPDAREEADTWLVRAASEPLAVYSSSLGVAAGTGATVGAPSRGRIIGLPQAQFRLWELTKDDPETAEEAAAWLFFAARAGYPPAVDEWAQRGN